jgi:hypothetical protein
MKYIKLFDAYDPKDKINNIAKKIAIQLGYKKAKYLGDGGFGYVFDIGDGKALKITDDGSEATNAQYLSKKSTNPYIINYYDVRTFSYNNSKYYAIIMDKINPLSKMVDNEKFYQFIWDKFVVMYINDESDTELKNVILKYIESEYPNMLDKAIEVVDFYLKSRKGLKAAIKKYDLPIADLKFRNLGINADGDLLYYDIGAFTNKKAKEFKTI